MLCIRERVLLVSMTGAVLVMECEFWISVSHCYVLRATVVVC